jgi:hypothetical protein
MPKNEMLPILKLRTEGYGLLLSIGEVAGVQASLMTLEREV